MNRSHLTKDHMKSQRIITRTFGVFFLLAFLSYGIGTGIVNPIIEAAYSPANIKTNSTQLIVGVILMALVHTIVNIGLPVLMIPTLKRYNKVLSYGYLSAGITATVVLIVGTIFVLLFVPLSAAQGVTDKTGILQHKTIAELLAKANFYAYQIGMAIWGFGGLMFCRLLYISRLVPKMFSVWGFVGYLIFIAGTISELFGSGIGVQLALSGGLFEITLSIWLIVKGFRYDAGSEQIPSHT